MTTGDQWEISWKSMGSRWEVTASGRKGGRQVACRGSLLGIGWLEPKSIFISFSRHGPEQKKKAPAKGRCLNILERKTGLEPATYGLEGHRYTR